MVSLGELGESLCSNFSWHSSVFEDMGFPFLWVKGWYLWNHASWTCFRAEGQGEAEHNLPGSVLW
jgi:hypothetical protein